MTAATPTNVALQRQILTTRERAVALVIKTPEDYTAAAELVRSIVELSKQIDATFDPIIADAYRAHKTAVETKKRFSLPVLVDRDTISRKMLAWSNEQERIRRAREEEIAKAAREAEEKRALAEAAELERQGEPELADVVLENHIAAPAPVVSIASSVPKVAGFAKRVNWRWRISNVDLIPRQYMMPNEIAINGVVRSLKDKCQIPGLEIFSEDSAIHRS